MAHVSRFKQRWTCACGQSIRVEVVAAEVDDDAVLEKDAVDLGWHKMGILSEPGTPNVMCPGCRGDEVIASVIPIEEELS